MFSLVLVRTCIWTSGRITSDFMASKPTAWNRHDSFDINHWVLKTKLKAVMEPTVSHLGSSEIVVITTLAQPTKSKLASWQLIIAKLTYQQCSVCGKVSTFCMVYIESTGPSRYYFERKNILLQSSCFAGLAHLYAYTQEPQFHYTPKFTVMFTLKSAYVITLFSMCISSIICSYYCNYANVCGLYSCYALCDI